MTGRIYGEDYTGAISGEDYSGTVSEVMGAVVTESGIQFEDGSFLQFESGTTVEVG